VEKYTQRAPRAGTLAIVTLAEMYSEAKALYDSIFVAGAEQIREKLRRELLPYEYRAVIEALAVLNLDVQRLGFLADSHDADILVRITAARNQFASMIRLAEVHSRLSAEIQAALGKDYRTSWAPLRGSAGHGDRRSSVVDHLKQGLPGTMEGWLALGSQLRDVLGYSMPTRTFLKFIPQDRGPVAQAVIYARKPALWRRLVRTARARIERAFRHPDT
jgi:hypothetical protein